MFDITATHKMYSGALFATIALSAFGYLLIGYDNGVMGGIINGNPFQHTFFPNSAPDDPKNNTILGTIVAIYEIGCCVGSLATAVVGDRLGRRKCIGVGSILMLAGAGMQAGVSSVGPMIAARVISGLGMGFINSTCPVILAEAAPSATRGRFLAAQLSCLNFGIFLAYWVGFGFSYVKEGTVGWRIPIALQCCFIIPIGLLVLVVPESSRWLASKGRGEEAIRTISRLRGRDTTDPYVQEEYEAIMAAVEAEQAIGNGGWLELFKNDDLQNRKRFLIACGIQIMQQLGGINGIIYYSGTLLKTTGLSNYGASLVSGILFTWFFIASFIPWFLIDSVGRRKLLLVCISLMAACFAAEAGLIWKVGKGDAKTAGIGAVAVLFVYMGLFTTGFQAVVWVYPSEILSLKYRQKGSAVSTACNWIINYTIVQITPLALGSIKYKYYIIFAIINASFVPVIYIFFPETKGLTLEDVDSLFSRSGPIRHQPSGEVNELASGGFDSQGKGASEHLEKIEKL